MENGKKEVQIYVCFALYRKPCCQYQYYYGLQSLDYIDDILTMQLFCLQKFIVPIYIRAGESAIRSIYS